jgi:hypothetical protein
VVSEVHGLIVPFGEPYMLRQAIATALLKPWDAAKIIAYAHANTWSERVEILVRKFKELPHD